MHRNKGRVGGMKIQETNPVHFQILSQFIPVYQGKSWDITMKYSYVMTTLFFSQMSIIILQFIIHY
jgi:hypothetical protein